MESPHNPLNLIQIVADPIEVTPLLAAVACPEAGASSLFLGTVRNHNKGKGVLFLEYECYPEMAVKEIAQIVAQARNNWELYQVGILHRVGRLQIGEVAVAIAISSAHRQASLEALQFCIDTLKATVPIWKKEYWEDGSIWLENCCG
ncbi:MAG: molybdenum cofactor biosynthesis protein MoaE [Candidatus Sericytochromatia bacterium]|nr:molybdenum cofactor biosynthesis protein MoaE [Candidatus Sericytochromatia bacterium]